MQSTAKKAALPAMTLAALGVVFGDIGTSPLYALKESFHAAHGLGITPANVLGILSIIFWTMTMVITIKYSAIVMRADNNGEGGIMALLALNLRNTNFSHRKKLLLISIGFIGASLFFGDVTDAIVKRGALESARRIKSIMGMVLKLPLKKRVITYNPAYDITLPQPIKTNHKAIVNEKELKELLVKIWRYCAENPRARKRTELAIKLSAYIYQRPNEVRHLLWESVDFDNQCLSFVASKTHQDHIVPLSRQVFDILKELEGLRTTSKYVFPSVKTPLESMSEDTIRQALIRLGFQGRHTAHGFRATARTILGEEIEYRTDIVEHQLAHTVKDPNGTAYNRTKFLRRRKQLMQLWADYLDTLRQGGDVSVFKPQDKENIIQFNQSNKSA